jgi:pyruvate dehydrogenase E2 component (dihydrolipoamide acetyltransferase)
MPIEVIMPSLGAVSEENTLVRWLVDVGDQIEKGSPMFEAESDKATVEVQAPETGEVGVLLAEPGTVILAGKTIAWLLKANESADDIPGFSESATPKNFEEPSEIEAIAPRPKGVHLPNRRIASPRARRLANEKGVNLDQLQGTGPMGRIVEADVKDALENGILVRGAQPYSLQPQIPGIRGRIARKMAESAHTTAPVTLTTETSAESLLRLRKSLQDELPEFADLFSFDLLFTLVSAKALLDHPSVNASITSGGINIHSQVNIGIAIDTDDGLVVPVISDVLSRELIDLGNDLNQKKQLAMQGRLRPEDLRGGTFTITNLGILGIDAFTPIINIPEVAVLGIGRIIEKPVAERGRIRIENRITLSLTFDHRAVDGGPAARFLQRTVKIVEAPERMLIGWLNNSN